MVLPSGETSTDIHVPASVVKRAVRVVTMGSVLVGSFVSVLCGDCEDAEGTSRTEDARRASGVRMPRWYDKIFRPTTSGCKGVKRHYKCPLCYAMRTDPWVKGEPE